jgi:predicted DNA-binding antitoxin AbrB/MazE fold protein
MTKTMEAIYAKGVLNLPAPLPLPEMSLVTVTIQSPSLGDDAECAAWLKVSEDKLTSVWDDSDDVFNELLKK